MKKKLILKGKVKAELVKMLAEKREELRALRFASAGARPKDASAPGKTRRDIARILTELGREAKVAK